MSGNPGSAPTGWSPPGEVPRQRPSRAVILTAGAVVVVLLVAIIVGGLVLFRPHLSGQHPASLSTPPQVAGLELSDDPILTDAAVQFSAMITSGADLDNAVAAFYTDPRADQQLVLIVGGTGALRNPADELDTAFRGASEGGLPISDRAAVDPGPLGGVAECGQGSAEGIVVAVCGSADHGSLVLGVFFNRTVEDSAALLRDIRAGVLTR